MQNNYYYPPQMQPGMMFQINPQQEGQFTDMNLLQQQFLKMNMIGYNPYMMMQGQNQQIDPNFTNVQQSGIRDASKEEEN